MHLTYIFILSHYAGDVICIQQFEKPQQKLYCNGVLGCGEITGSCLQM